jgi:hypothetical protein
MRSSTFSSLAILASSLLVKEVFAGRYDVRKRDLYVVTDSVIVTEQVIVTEAADGSFATGTPEAIATVTIDGTPVLVPASTSAAPTIAPTTPTAAPASPSSSSLGAILIQESSSAAPAPTTSTTPVVVIPTTTSTPPVVVPATTPTTLATAVSSSAPVSTGSTTSGSKRGVAYNDASLLSGFTSGSSQVSWAYNWGDTSSGLTGLEYVPMLWGLGSHTNGWTAAATNAIAAGSTALLTFNEPDLSSQSNIDYETAAQGFMDNVQQFAGKARLGAPAVTNGGAPMGLTYMQNFLGACKTKGCTIDFVCIHWYNGGTADDFKTYVQNAYTQSGNLPVWITEFQAPGDTAEQIAFLQEVIPWLDSQSFVEKYAYFMASDGILLSAGSTLSTLGETFASYE